MELYLLRHGIADDHLRDADRALTEEGKRKLAKVLKRAKKAAVQPTLILSSPLKRALETAQQAAQALDYKSEIARSNALLPDSTPHDLWSEVRAHRDEPSLLLVGHQPLFSQTVAYLVGSTRSMVEFKRGALVRIDVSSHSHEPRGVLEWMITPKVC